MECLYLHLSSNVCQMYVNIPDMDPSGNDFQTGFFNAPAFFANEISETILQPFGVYQAGNLQSFRAATQQVFVTNHRTLHSSDIQKSHIFQDVAI